MPDDAEYDYVIAGGGTGGSVLAGRLSEDPSVRVLLLEAGRSDRHPFIHMPAGFPRLKGGPYQWAYSSVPQKHSNGRSIPLPKAAGSAAEGPSTPRSSPAAWPRTTTGGPRTTDARAGPPPRCPSISFARSQTPGSQDPTTEPQGRSASRTSGVRTRSRRHSCRRARSSGCPTTAISTGPKQLGVGFYQTTTKNGRRCSAAVAYLKPARKRPNLTVRVNVTVSKVVIKNGRAVGIQTIEGGVARTLQGPA